MTATCIFEVFSSLDGLRLRERRQLGRLLGQAGPRAAGPPPRLIRRAQRIAFGAKPIERSRRRSHREGRNHRIARQAELAELGEVVT
jgi:hypothetical protein